MASGSYVVIRDAMVVAVAWLAAVAMAADVHVAPHGNDTADGSAERPVASLRRALDRAREIRAADGARCTPVEIAVADGRYQLAKPVVITPEDSGTEKYPTVIRAEAGASPVFSGGRVIRGWEVASADGATRWTVHLPEVKAGTWNFSQLFVNDQRRFRPVLPASGWHTIAGKLDPSPAATGKGHDRFVFSGDDLRADWANLADVEVVAVHKWTMSRLPIATITPLETDAAHKVVTFAGHTCGAWDWCSFPKGNRFLVENIREALGTPGSWYLDQPTGMLTYCPLPGETPETAVVIAPLAERLLECRGDAAAGRLVEHVRFEGLSFAHGNWTMPRGGQSYPQAETNVGGAIMARGARHLAFDRCAVRHVGRYAIEFRAGCIPRRWAFGSAMPHIARSSTATSTISPTPAFLSAGHGATGRARPITTGSPTTIFTKSATACSPTWEASIRWASRPARPSRGT